ncbi:MAG: hypothetical protein WCV84_03170 [Patescibacteria group bacterium]
MRTDLVEAHRNRVLRIQLLARIGFNNAEMASLLSVTPNTIRRDRRRAQIPESSRSPKRQEAHARLLSMYPVAFAWYAAMEPRYYQTSRNMGEISADVWRRVGQWLQIQRITEIHEVLKFTRPLERAMAEWLADPYGHLLGRTFQLCPLASTNVSACWHTLLEAVATGKESTPQDPYDASTRFKMRLTREALKRQQLPITHMVRRAVDNALDDLGVHGLLLRELFLQEPWPTEGREVTPTHERALEKLRQSRHAPMLRMLAMPVEQIAQELAIQAIQSPLHDSGPGSFILNLPVSELLLSRTTHFQLDEAGLAMVGQVFVLTEDEFLNLPGMEEKELLEVKHALGQYGLHFRMENNTPPPAPTL